MYDKEELLTQKSFVFSESNMELKYMLIKKRDIGSRYYSVAVITRDFDGGG